MSKELSPLPSMDSLFSEIDDLSERIAELEQQNLALAAAIEAKDVALQAEYDYQSLNYEGEIASWIVDGLAINPSPDLLAKRDQMRDAALLALLDSCADMLPPCGLRDKVHAVISESGEWNPILEIK